MDVRRCTVAELEAAPNLFEVLEEYAREAATPELGPAVAQIETYRAMEATGMFHPIAAFDDDLLVGFILPVVVVLPHYGVIAATIESFFVPAADRKRGVGLALLGAAEDLARELGAKALLLSAPAGGVLSRVMRARRGYRHNSETFVKALA